MKKVSIITYLLNLTIIDGRIPVLETNVRVMSLTNFEYLSLFSFFNYCQVFLFGAPSSKEVFRTCNVLPFSCTHLALWKVKDPRYMQNKKDSRISLGLTVLAHDLKSSSNVSLQFAWITWPATDPSLFFFVSPRTFVLIRMSHCRTPATDGAEF